MDRFAWKSMILLLLGVPAWAQDVVQKPFFVLNAGGHTNIIKPVLFSHDGKEIITIAEDKTVRVWDAHTGTPLRTLRTPIEHGAYGRLDAGALSPDGRILAVAGFGENIGKNPIYLIHYHTGEMKRVLRGHTSSISCLAFSPQGNILASGSGDHTIRIWDLDRGESIQVLKGHSKRINGLAFSPRGRDLASGSDDATGRIWNLENASLHCVLEGHQKSVACVAWSRDGKRLATGGWDQTIRLWDPNGKLVHTFDHLKGNILSLTFISKDRELLFSTSTLGMTGGLRRAGCLDLYSTGKVRVEVPHTNNVFAAAARNGLAVSSGGDDYETIVWQVATGKPVCMFGGKGKTPWAAAWSVDESFIAWGNSNVSDSRKIKNPLEKTFSLQTLEWGGPPDNRFQGPRLTLGSTSLAFDKTNDLTVTKNGKPQTIAKWIPSAEMVRCGTLLPDGLAAIGTDSRLSIVDLGRGKIVRNLEGHVGSLWSVASSPSGRFLLSAAGDQTLKIWSLETEAEEKVGLGIKFKYGKDFYLVETIQPGGPAAKDGRLKAGDKILEFSINDEPFVPCTKENFSLFSDPTPDARQMLKVQTAKGMKVYEFKRAAYTKLVTRKEPLVSLFFAGTEWAAWTPEGYYAASPGGERLFGWHFNNGPDQMATFHSTGQFRQSLYRPDVIKLLLKTGSVKRAVEQADQVAGRKSNYTQVAEIIPPKVSIVTPTANASIQDANVDVRVRASSVGKHPVTALQLLIDGRPFRGNKGVYKVPSAKIGDVENSWSITLTPGKHRLAVKADSSVSSAVSEEVEIHYNDASPVETVKLPSLYVVAIGISDYPGNLKLNFANKDAQGLAQAFQKNSKGLFEKIEIKELTDKQATRREILKSITWLSEQMTQRDVGVVFLAGHGEIAATGDFYYLPVDVDVQDLVATGVSGYDLKKAMSSMPGRIVFMLDACHSGSFEGPKKRGRPGLTDDLIRDLVTDDSGVIALCASTGKQFALESTELEHGMFTLALIEALEGKAQKTLEGAVYLHHLDAYVTDRVKELSKGRQSPTTARPANVRSFPIAKPG